MTPAHHQAHAIRLAAPHQAAARQAIFTALTNEFWSGYGYAERTMARRVLALYGMEDNARLLDQVEAIITDCLTKPDFTRMAAEVLEVVSGVEECGAV